MNEGSTLPIPKDPSSMYGSSNLYLGIVRSVDDPQQRGRVLVECPAVYGSDDPEHWSTWAEYCANSISSSEKDGDMGVWWPATPGQLVLLGFEAGHPEKPFCIPMGAWGDEGDPQTPKEIKALKKKCINARIFKSPAGHTIFFDDNGTTEAMMICDWTGTGWFSMAPGKKEDAASSSPCTKSKMRKGECRGTKSAMIGNTADPQELLKDGEMIVGHLDLNGQGWTQTISKDGSRLSIFANKKKGEIGPSFILDAEKNRVVITAGETQFIVDGKAQGLYGTKILIWERPFENVVDGIKGTLKKVSDYFKRYRSDSSGDNGGTDA